jgi:hypothetical protein
LPAKIWRRQRKLVVSTLITEKYNYCLLLDEEKSQNSYSDVGIWIIKYVCTLHFLNT